MAATNWVGPFRRELRDRCGGMRPVPGCRGVSDAQTERRKIPREASGGISGKPCRPESVGLGEVGQPKCPTKQEALLDFLGPLGEASHVGLVA